MAKKLIFFATGTGYPAQCVFFHTKLVKGGYADFCVTLTPYIKGPPGTVMYKALLVGTCMSARKSTMESFDRYKVARKQ